MVSDTDTELKYFSENIPYAFSGKSSKSDHVPPQFGSLYVGSLYGNVKVDTFCVVKSSYFASVPYVAVPCMATSKWTHFV